MGNENLPSKQGQICRKLVLQDGENADDVYIITDFVIAESEDSPVTVVSLSELQRNITNPDNVPRIGIAKGNLQVVAENLSSFVESWNEPYNKKYILNTTEDVKQFFRDVHKMYLAEFHPDDDFKDFTDEQGNRSFTEEQAEHLNKIMINCFQFCDDNDLDIYDIASAVQIEIWQKQGLWPKS
jgi:hypothetical protein